ncbi:MAG: hypothetical protein ACTHPS_13110 [Streptosporangiaceae bacterium]
MAETTVRAGPRRRGARLLGRGYARHPGDAVRLVAGCVVVLLTALAIHEDYVGSREMAVFRVVNGLALPGWTWPGVWLVMQLGVISRAPTAAASPTTSGRWIPHSPT